MFCNSDNTRFSSPVANGSEGTDVMTEFVLLPENVQQTEPADAEEAREEVHPAADNAAKSKRNRVGRFFRAAWKAVKPLKKNKVTPFVPQNDAESPGPEMKADAKAEGEDDIHLDKAAKSKRNRVGRFFRAAWKAVKPLKNKKVTPFVPQTDAESPEEDNNHLVPVLNDYLYDASKILGSGSFGNVYGGFRKSDGKKVAVKVMSRSLCNMLTIPHLDNHPYPSEVALMLVLQRAPAHPNIIQMYDWCETEETLTLVMEFPHPCVTLTDIICSQGRLSELQAHYLWVQAVRAVHHCLKQDVFHADVHVENILINTETLELKLIDFGVGFIVRNSNWPLTGYFACEDDDATSSSLQMLGDVLYVMVHGCPPPPYGDVLNIDTNISSELQDLIKLCKRRELILTRSIQDIIDHPWYKRNQNKTVNHGIGQLVSVTIEKMMRKARYSTNRTGDPARSDPATQTADDLVTRALKR